MNFSDELFLFVTFFELVDTSCSIHQHFLAGEERVRGIRNFKLYKGVVVAVFPFDCFSCGSCRTAKESFAVTHVFENYQSVTLWMNILFHNALIVCTDFAVRFKMEGEITGILRKNKAVLAVVPPTADCRLPALRATPATGGYRSVPHIHKL
jgi:hypothetical protein